MKYFSALCLFVISALAVASGQTSWQPYGPGGGDVRSFASDPSDHNHIYLGTVVGILYESHDGGKSWKRLAQIDKRDDLALDNILVDPANPKHLVLGAWVLGSHDGGVYVSNDAGHTWTSNAQMKGHSIRALSSAPSDPKIMVLGALDGVYRSTDSGENWSRISPEENKEIHEVESIAIDPKDPQIIYAGTWHLPWKTTDGGANWSNMKQGIIDDSDVFSIIVDPTNESNIYLSACSGIYRSTDKGNTFTKVQGIPSTARRTRVLMEDAKQPGTVFAGTTEGIWRSTDAGHAFQRNGDPALIVNDINIDPTDSNRVLLATDRNGVMLSTDGGQTFAPSNDGFSTRQITAVVQDAKESNKVYVGVLNDKTAGGVFTSNDGGEHWAQLSDGLNGADVFSLGQSADGTVLAGTRHGIYRLEGTAWKQSGMTNALPPLPEAPQTKTIKLKNGKTISKTLPAKKPAKLPPPAQTAASIYGLSTIEGKTFAATDAGMLVSTDDGHTWNHIRSADGIPLRTVSAMGSKVAAIDHKLVVISKDGGESFANLQTPAELTAVHSIAVDKKGRIWLGGREGVYLSENDGASWHTQDGLYVPNVSAIYYDATSDRVLVTSNGPDTLVFAVNAADMKVSHLDSGWVLKQVRPVGGRLFGVTAYEGVVLQPHGSDAVVATN